MAESMRHETFYLCCHKYTAQGVNIIFANVRCPPGPGPGAVTPDGKRARMMKPPLFSSPMGGLRGPPIHIRDDGLPNETTEREL